MTWFGPVLLGAAAGLALLGLMDWCIAKRRTVLARRAEEKP